MISLTRQRQHLPRRDQILSQGLGSEGRETGAMMVQHPTGHDEVQLAPLTCANQSLSCQLLVVGGGLSGLSAAEAAVMRGIDGCLCALLASAMGAAGRRVAQCRRLNCPIRARAEMHVYFQWRKGLSAF